MAQIKIKTIENKKGKRMYNYSCRIESPTLQYEQVAGPDINIDRVYDLLFEQVVKLK